MKCIVCGNNEKFTKLSPEYCLADNWLCETCGLVFIPRVVNEKHDFYKEGGYYNDSVNLAARSFMTSRYLLMQLAKNRVEEIEKLAATKLTNMSVLDVGCGYGETLGYLKRHHQCTVLGVEPSPETAKVGERMFDIKIAPMLFEEYEFGSDTFDLIMCNHALEHVVDPKQFLELLKLRLKPDGILYLEVPNVMWPSGGFELKDFLYDEHLQTFSSWNLYILVEQAGYELQAYSDKNFIQFICVANIASHVEKSVDLQPLAANEIKQFLKSYKENYTIIQCAHVYVGKALYLLKLLYSKMVDMTIGQILA